VNDGNQAGNRVNCFSVYTFHYVLGAVHCEVLNTSGGAHPVEFSISDACHDEGVSAGSAAYDDCCANDGDGC